MHIPEGFTQSSLIFSSNNTSTNVSPSNPNTPRSAKSSKVIKRLTFDSPFNSGYSTPSIQSPNLTKRLLKIEQNQLNKTKVKYIDSKKMRQDSSIFQPFFLITPPESPTSAFTLSNEPTVEISRYLNEFEQLQLLGEGSTGQVYKCRNRLDGAFYAVKRIELNNSSSYQEALTMAASSAFDDNKYMVRYHNVWEENGYLYLCMELCEHSLQRHIELNGQPNDEYLRKIMRDVCKGLQKLHHREIVHLDLKSENILLNRQGRFKIGDLGLARLQKQVKDIPEGDSRYIAPEVLGGNEIDLTKADMFSFGAMFYEIMRQKVLPKRGEEWYEIRLGNIDMQNNYSKPLKQAVQSLLDPDPEKRPSAQDLLKKLLISPAKQQLKQYIEYCRLLEDQIKKRGSPIKRRKLSF